MTSQADKPTGPQPDSIPPPQVPSGAAALPPSRTAPASWRMPAIVVSAAALVCVGAGVLVGLYVASARRVAPEALQKRYRQAEHDYRLGQYAQACEACRELRDLAPDTTHAAKARVLLRFAQTRMALAAGDVKSARSRLVEAEELLDELADTEGLRGWVAAVRADNELHPRIATEWAESHRILTAARQLLAQGQARAALHFLTRELPGARLSVQQQDELKDLRGAIYGALFTEAVRRSIRTGSHLTDAGRFDKADWAFADAQTNLQEAELAGCLAADVRQALQAALSAAIEKLTHARAFETASEQIRLAREEGKLAAERDALQRALAAADKVRPSRVAGLKQRLAAVELEIAFVEALTRAEQAPNDQAVAILEQFAADHPEHAEAASALAAMKADRQWGKIITEGDAAMRAGQWSRAHEKYEAAARIKQDDALADRLAHAEYETTMQAARKARADKRYDDALAAADRAAGVYPAAAEKVQAFQDETRQQQKYDADLSAAKAAVAAEKLAEALRILQAIQPQTPEVLTLRDQLTYQQQRQLAIDAMRRRDYPTAYEHLKAAKEHAQPGEQTRQIIELMSRVEPLLKPPAPEPAPLRAAPELRMGLIRRPLYQPFGSGMYGLYSNGYFPYVAFGYHDQVYLGGQYYPIFYRRHHERGPSRHPRRVLKFEPKPLLPTGKRP